MVKVLWHFFAGRSAGHSLLFSVRAWAAALNGVTRPSVSIYFTTLRTSPFATAFACLAPLIRSSGHATGAAGSFPKRNSVNRSAHVPTWGSRMRPVCGSPPHAPAPPRRPAIFIPRRAGSTICDRQRMPPSQRAMRARSSPEPASHLRIDRRHVENHAGFHDAPSDTSHSRCGERSAHGKRSPPATRLSSVLIQPCNNTFNEIHRSFTPQIADNGTLTTRSEVTRG